MLHRIVCPNWRPTPDNNLTDGSHWAKKHRLKKQDKAMIKTYAMLANVLRATGKRLVSLEITLSGRQQEADPLAYGKSLNDALVSCGMLIDDSDRYMVWGGVTYSRGEPQTVIVLEDLEE